MMSSQQTPLERELEFWASVQAMSMSQQAALLLRMREAQGKPDPERVWSVVQVTGGRRLLVEGVYG